MVGLVYLGEAFKKIRRLQTGVVFVNGLDQTAAEFIIDPVELDQTD